MQHVKPKSTGKIILPKGEELTKVILETMATISDVVGATYGPGGQQVIIERYEDLPPVLTKDGVSVFKSLGFQDSVAQCIFESARDAAVRTAQEAGDGTTLSSILSEAIVRNMFKYCSEHPKESPQKIVRRLEAVFRDKIKPLIKTFSQKPDFSTKEGREILKSVAKVSANGDLPLAESVLQCFDLVGDTGNVTISEQSGPSSYEVEKIDGYPIPIGYEESCAKFYPKFINDSINQRLFMKDVLFVVNHGPINDLQTIKPALETIGYYWQKDRTSKFNVVLVATGFSELVLGTLAMNFANPNTINVFPLVAPKNQQMNGQQYFLEDVCTITGAKMFNPIDSPLESAKIEDFGPGVESFESYRYKSTIFGHVSEDLIILATEKIEGLIKNPESDLDRILLQERLGKVSGGIARLKVIGASSGELKEKKDRAEDAVCAVKGTIAHGYLPGGGWTLMKLINTLIGENDDMLNKVLGSAFFEPIMRLYTNSGLSVTESLDIASKFMEGIRKSESLAYDTYSHSFVDPFQSGLLDSTPAILEAIRNSLSIAALLGTLGGAVVYPRDDEFDKAEAHKTAEFLRHANVNEANLRP